MDAQEAKQPGDGDLQIWWIPQIPGKRFEVPVATPEEGAKILSVLAAYDMFQLHQKIKGDYSNMGGLSVFVDGDWEDWENEDGDGVDSIRSYDEGFVVREAARLAVFESRR